MIFHWAAAFLTTILWIGFYMAWSGQNIDLTQIKMPGNEWRAWLYLATIVGITFLLFSR